MSFLQLQPTDIVVSSDAVTAPAWSTGAPTLTKIVSASSVAPSFYLNAYNSASAATISNTSPEFSVAYGHLYGSGSAPYNSLVTSSTPTRTIYGQYRTLVYGDENANFNFGTGNTTSRDIYVINVQRSDYKESLFPGTFNLRLTSGSTQLWLTDNSNDVSTVTYLDCGRAFTIVSGSNGSATLLSPTAAPTATKGQTPSGSYGLYLPDIGTIILNPRALALAPASGGISLAVTESNGTLAPNNVVLYNSISGSTSYSASFSLNSQETVSSDYVFVRVPNQAFNYTTNPSIISGSGALLYSSLINFPQTYITTVGLYNSAGDLLAVAKLSKPLVKDFTKEALIQVKLNW
jgi:hypothetical protein